MVLDRARLTSITSLMLLLGSACGDSAGQTTNETSDSSTTIAETGTTGSESSTDSGTSETGTPPDLPAPVTAPEPLVVMTFNILCSFCDDTYAPWDERVPYIVDTITRHDPDIAGLQELFTADEVDQLHALLPEYDVLFYSDETSDYADASIWWRADRYNLVESGFYWLSPAPDTPFSVGFSPPQLPRMVAWAIFHEPSSDADFLFVTTHFDNNSPSQELSAPLLLERTQLQAGNLPIIVTGDFNSRPDSVAYGILANGVEPGGFALTNSYDLTNNHIIDSNENPVTNYDPSIRIDHMWVANGTWMVPWWTVDTWVYGDPLQHTSDHFAMATELHFQGP